MSQIKTKEESTQIKNGRGEIVDIETVIDNRCISLYANDLIVFECARNDTLYTKLLTAYIELLESMV